MVDKNKNGTPDGDEFYIHKESLWIGTGIGIFGGGILLKILVYFFPALAGILGIFQGSMCEDVQTELGRCKEAVSCSEARMDPKEFALCKSKLEVEEN